MHWTEVIKYRTDERVVGDIVNDDIGPLETKAIPEGAKVFIIRCLKAYTSCRRYEGTGTAAERTMGLWFVLVPPWMALASNEGGRMGSGECPTKAMADASARLRENAAQLIEKADEIDKALLTLKG